MRHRKKGKSLGRTRAPRQALMRNMATSAVLYEQIRTTESKAKAIKPVIEKYVTMSRDNSLHTRRKLLSFFYDEKAVNKLLEEIGPRYKERNGGYMRIVKIGRREGDGARVVQLEFV